MNNMIYALQEVDEINIDTNTFYVIENFPYPQFVTDTDGSVKSFDNYAAACAEAEDYQEGYVIAF